MWFSNVPHKELTVEKKKQNWVVYEGERFRFPGGGTMFPRGADAYIDDIGKIIRLKDGSIRTAIDTGCGVRFSDLSLLNVFFFFVFLFFGCFRNFELLSGFFSLVKVRFLSLNFGLTINFVFKVI